MKKNVKNILSIVLSIILVFFIFHKFLVSGNTIIFTMIFIASCVFFNKVIENEYKRKFIVSITIAIIFAFVELICTSINTDYTLNHILDKWCLLNFVGYTILIWSSISIVYNFLEKNRFKIKDAIKIGKYKILSDSKSSFCINVILIFLAWLPYFLAYYPGLLTADSCAQVLQAIGISELSNHHPIVHTFIISVFVNCGRIITGNINIGVSLYILFQMITMAVFFSIILKYISKKNAPIIVRILALLYYMFYPVHALFSVTMWKDILFSGIIPVYVILTIELIYNNKEFLEKKKNIIIYIIVSLLVMFLRNNGLYIVLLTLPFIIILLRKYWKKILAIVGTILLLYIVIKSLIFNIFNVKEGSVGEMLSIPLQQIARVKKYHKEDLDNYTVQQIDEFFLCNNIEEKYNPVLSDPVKAELNTNYFNENKIEFIKLWIKLLKRYFKDYVESFISNSYGYYYPEATHWVANRTMEENNLGITQNPLIDGKLVLEINSYIERREIPLISMLFSIGMEFWMTVVCMGYEVLRRNYKMVIPYLIIYILWLTIVASPVFCEYRYAYPLFTTLPLYININYVKREKENE